MRLNALRKTKQRKTRKTRKKINKIYGGIASILNRFRYRHAIKSPITNIINKKEQTLIMKENELIEREKKLNEKENELNIIAKDVPYIKAKLIKAKDIPNFNHFCDRKDQNIQYIVYKYLDNDIEIVPFPNASDFEYRNEMNIVGREGGCEIASKNSDLRIKRF
jgi:hypothetical protein